MAVEIEITSLVERAYMAGASEYKRCVNILHGEGYVYEGAEGGMPTRSELIRTAESRANCEPEGIGLSHEEAKEIAHIYRLPFIAGYRAAEAENWRVW